MWLVNHCHTVGHREDYAKELAKYIRVDIFGRCGNETNCGKGNSECLERLVRKYKFYLSFENSYCEDYVTEKLEKPLKWELVPIVYGGTNYARDAPPGSVINIEDYRSPRHLAEYLHRLSHNETGYAEYFQWRQTHEIKHVSTTQVFCQLCDVLHSHNFYKAVSEFPPLVV